MSAGSEPLARAGPPRHALAGEAAPGTPEAGSQLLDRPSIARGRPSPAVSPRERSPRSRDESDSPGELENVAIAQALIERVRHDRAARVEEHERGAALTLPPVSFFDELPRPSPTCMRRERRDGAEAGAGAIPPTGSEGEPMYRDGRYHPPSLDGANAHVVGASWIAILEPARRQGARVPGRAERVVHQQHAVGFPPWRKLAERHDPQADLRGVGRPASWVSRHVSTAAGVAKSASAANTSGRRPGGGSRAGG